MASDYTKGPLERAAKLVFENLPSSFTNGAKDPHAREEMHNASCMAGMAFGNAFLGLNHSMAHSSALSTICPTASQTQSS